MKLYLVVCKHGGPPRYFGEVETWTADVLKALAYGSEAEADNVAHDWQVYWNVKGYPYIADVECFEVTGLRSLEDTFDAAV